jgi:DNA-binding XRE family transcriptional regulator
MPMRGEQMKALRLRAEKTQDEVAVAIGMSRKSINEMEAGKTPIELRTELALRYVLGEPE